MSRRLVRASRVELCLFPSGDDARTGRGSSLMRYFDCLLIGIVSFLMGTPPAAAAPFVVDSTVDSVDAKPSAQAASGRSRAYPSAWPAGALIAPGTRPLLTLGIDDPHATGLFGAPGGGLSRPSQQTTHHACASDPPQG